VLNGFTTYGLSTVASVLPVTPGKSVGGVLQSSGIGCGRSAKAPQFRAARQPESRARMSEEKTRSPHKYLAKHSLAGWKVSWSSLRNSFMAPVNIFVLAKHQT